MRPYTTAVTEPKAHASPVIRLVAIDSKMILKCLVALKHVRMS